MTDSQSAFVSGGKRQKYLGNRGLIALIAFLSAFVPLSTDLYLPALPGMSKYFGISRAGQSHADILLHRFCRGNALLGASER